MVEVIIYIGTFSTVVYLLILLYLMIGIIRTRVELVDAEPFISIIVAAHNEGENIKNCLDSLLNLDYPDEKIEIIIVNDRSKDDTGMILDGYNKKCNYLNIIDIKNENDRKIDKKINALRTGINNSKGEIIITTDADCIVPSNWIKRINSFFTSNTGMVVGLSPNVLTKWWLSGFLCIDALLADLIAYGSLGWGHAITCTGRNLAYRRSVYNEIDGFSGIDHLMSVDDDVFMQKIAKNTSWEIKYMMTEDSVVKSPSSENWAHFISQRKRYIASAKSFPFSVQLGYSLLYGSKFFILFSFIVAIFTNFSFNSHLILQLLTFIYTLLLFYFIAIKTNQISLLILYPLWELYYILSYLFIGPLGLFGHVNWDSRYDLNNR